MDKENLSIVALNMLPELPPKKILDLISFFGSANNVILSDTKELETKFNLSKELCLKIKNLKSLDIANKEVELATKNSINIYTYTQEEYPKQLKNICDYPPVLYVKGQLLESDKISISIVGSRRATNYGLCATEEFCKYFANHNITTISGLARGIDAQTHKTTIENGGRTIAVVGNGLLEYYPPENKKLQNKIYDNGAVISEFPLTKKALPINFPRRNRIVAGLSLATLVIEAAQKSGSLITAELACEYNKDVFALPGQIFSKYSQGPNNLIKNGSFVALCPEDIVNQIPILQQWCLVYKQNKTNEIIDKNISKDGIKILKMLQSQVNGLALDQISLKCNIDIGQLSVILVELEINGFVKVMPGQIYVSLYKKKL